MRPDPECPEIAFTQQIGGSQPAFESRPGVAVPLLIGVRTCS